MSETFDCVDYVVTHMDYPIVQDDLYKGLCVGNIRLHGMLSEQDGKNISEYNERINEVTGLYWIWKNTKSKYVGMSHYRRFLMDGDKRIGKEKIHQLLVEDGNDIIMSRIGLGWSVYRNICMASGEGLSGMVHGILREAIQAKQPKYVEAFDEVMSGNEMYLCNIFISSRKVMNAYCRWLFSFLLPVVDLVNVAGGTFYERRVCGYFCEALWTVWLKQQKLKVCELPLGIGW